MNTRTLLTSIDIGDSVQCDWCNTEFKGRDDKGGFLLGTYAVGPCCRSKIIQRLQDHDEMEEISEYCPHGMTFHSWVMQLRAGNNTIRVYSVD